jgi:tetratricopeptide (TPR) repeat protein
MFYWILGRLYFFVGKYEEAILWLQLSVELRKDLWYNRLYLASAYAIVGEQEHAEQTLSEFDKTFPRYTLKTVRENEGTNPNSHAFVMEGRRKFHLGLRLAGMPP